MKILSSSLLVFLPLIARASASDSVPWSYREPDTNSKGPSKWSEVDQQCSGKQQSPIDITVPHGAPANANASSAPLKFSGTCEQFNMTATEESYKGSVNGGDCKAIVAQDEYSLLQFHIHAPSEHTINGTALDGEVHFVHKKNDTALLVVGLFLEKQDGATTDSLVKAIWSSLAGPSAQLGSYSALLEKHISQGHLFNYPGSLTTPMCNEIVDWWVIQKPLPVAPADFDAFFEQLRNLSATNDGKNARPVQDLNDREVTIYPLAETQSPAPTTPAPTTATPAPSSAAHKVGALTTTASAFALALAFTCSSWL